MINTLNKFSVTRDAIAFGRQLREDFNGIRGDNESKEQLKMVASLTGRIVGVVAFVIGFYLSPLAVLVFVLGHDLMKMGENYRHLVNASGATLVEKLKAYAAKIGCEVSKNTFECHPLLLNTWVARHVYLLVTEYQHEVAQ